MQILFLSFLGNKVVRVDVMDFLSPAGFHAATEKTMKTLFRSGRFKPDICRIYLIKERKIIGEGGVINENGISLKQGS